MKRKKQSTSTPLVYMLAGIFLAAFGAVFMLESPFLGFVFAGLGGAMFFVGSIAAGVALGLEQHARLNANAELAKQAVPAPQNYTPPVPQPYPQAPQQFQPQEPQQAPNQPSDQ